MKKFVLDRAAVNAAIDAGQEQALIKQLERQGVTFDPRLGTIRFLKKDPSDYVLRLVQDTDGVEKVVCDAQPELVTLSNAGIPAWMTNYMDPASYEILLSPLEATEIVGAETQKGDWTTTMATFKTVESVGEVSSYGDFNNNGMTKVNVNFPHRQPYMYQTFTQWGELEAARYGQAQVAWAAENNMSSIKVINRYQNDTYFYGVSGLLNFGLLNDPSLYAPIAATAAWNAPSTTPEQIYEDIRRMFAKLQRQSNGVINSKSPMTLALSPYADAALDKTNQFGLSTRNQISKHFPNLTTKTAVQYTTAAGELVQLISAEVDGKKTAETAFNSKLRSHALITGHSSWSQKKSAGSYGTIIYYSFGISQLIGA
jgi:hypothetical protein